MKQVSFKDYDGVVRGGILLDNDDVICGCCGGIMESDDIEIVKVFDDWVDISNEILGLY